MPVMTITLVVILVILLLLSVPVAVSLGLASVATMLIYHPVTLELIPQLLYNNSTGFVMLAVPLFILAGNLMECGTIGRNLIDFVNSLVGNQTGGLGTVNIVGSMLFGGVSGSSLADTAVFGSILVPRMEAQGYPKDYAAGVTAISSCLSVIIPPSINIVVAAAVTSVSIARGMAAGVLPGLLLTLSMCVANWYLAGKHHYGTKIPFSWKNVGQTLKTTWTALLAPGIILGCIFSGIVTPTEAAAITVLYVLIVDALIYRKLSLKDIWKCLKDTGRMTSNILFIATSSAVASWIITYEGIPALMAQALANVPGGKYGFELLLILGVTWRGACPFRAARNCKNVQRTATSQRVRRGRCPHRPGGTQLQNCTRQGENAQRSVGADASVRPLCNGKLATAYRKNVKLPDTPQGRGSVLPTHGASTNSHDEWRQRNTFRFALVRPNLQRCTARRGRTPPLRNC